VRPQVVVITGASAGVGRALARGSRPLSQKILIGPIMCGRRCQVIMARTVVLTQSLTIVAHLLRHSTRAASQNAVDGALRRARTRGSSRSKGICPG